VREALEAKLGPISSAHLLAGGASKEAWAVDLADGTELLVRRASVGVIHRDTLTLEQEFQVLEAAVAAGVAAPRPVQYLGDVDGHEAFAMERVHGETIGRRIVRDPPAALPLQLAEQLARIHSIEPLDFLPRGDAITRFYDELDSVDEPHPAIEYGLAWVRERLTAPDSPTFCHGDFRVGNFAVDRDGLVSVLDWEFAHVGDPVGDVAWPIVRAWRFGADERRLGGLGEVEPYLERYNELSGRDVTLEELDVWEVFGNVKWAIGCLTQCRRHLNGQDRSVEYAVLGRMAAEMEYELLDLIEHA
jgi:aminoglycoside phosphotransferase (APT) family kinase protein